MGRLSGKTCLVTAAGQGIGRASAFAMQREGAQVIATDVDEDLLSDHAEAGMETFGLDVLDATAILAAAARSGPLHVLFNCAGYVHQGALLDCDEDAWTRSFDLNVTAMYRMLRAYVPGMIDNGGGSIINMASAVGSIIAAPNRFVYGATKAAVIGMTKSVAADYVQQGIRCNAVCPGTVDTPSLQDRIRALGDYDEGRKVFLARQPTGQLAGPDDIAPLVVYLASDDSRFVTGHAHVIDGGWSNV